MAQINRSEIESSLKRKGFEEENTHHRYFYYYSNGKRTQISTYTSHGSKYKVYGDPLLDMVKKQLKLTKSQLINLIECPLTQAEYDKFLREQGYIKASE
ncbi:MAG: hypothetical protein HYT97_06045 [Elusimicrobia bacterium]|nr:hypothetical protein [Elusimicrobiota bacterium]